MSTKRSPKQKSEVSDKPEKKGWRGFVNIELTEAQKETALTLCENNINFLEAIEGAVEADYRLSVNRQFDDDVFTATLTGTDQHPTDWGIAVSARSRSVDKAIAGVLVKLASAGEFGLAPLFSGHLQRETDL